MSKKGHSSMNYETAFWEAQNFLIASEAISQKAQAILISEFAANKTSDKSIGLQYAKYVNHSYAVELLLKCIMIIENKRFFAGHALLDLYKLLDSDTQIQLFEIYKKCNHIRRNMTYFGMFEEVTIVMVLEEAKEAFKDFRYLFEGRSTPKYNLDLVVACLEKYIFQIKPELRDLKI